MNLITLNRNEDETFELSISECLTEKDISVLFCVLLKHAEDVGMDIENILDCSLTTGQKMSVVLDVLSDIRIETSNKPEICN